MIVYFTVFVWLPVIFLFVLSMMQWNIVQWPPHFVGLENYRKILEDPYYHQSHLQHLLSWPLGADP